MSIVRTAIRFGYDYYYSGDYIRIGRDGDYMDLFPQGDMNALTLTLDRIGLENLLSYWAPVDEYYAYLLEAAYRNLYDFSHHLSFAASYPGDGAGDAGDIYRTDVRRESATDE